MKLKAPFPWFGGKSTVAEIVWQRFGDVPNYVEPFFGSGAVLLARPHPARIETVNDLDCYIANFWRAVQRSPAKVAQWADWPVNEADLHARHQWLVNRQGFREKIKSDPAYFDARIAGWWVWGISCWIGSGWCSKPEWSGRINAGNLRGRGVNARGLHPYKEHRRPNLGSSNGVHARNPRNAGQQIWRKRPNLNRSGRGVSRSLPDLGGDSGAAGRGIHGSARAVALIDWMQRLADRLHRVRVCCGDWKRILGRSPTECIGVTGIFLDPPYGKGRDTGIYSTDDLEVAGEVAKWAIANGDNPMLRIALCGYEGEHTVPDDWDCFAWKANAGYANSAKSGRGRANAHRERIWFSPHCLAPASPELWER